MLTTGIINADGTAWIDLAAPLDRSEPFIAQDGDFSPFFMSKPRMLGRRIRQETDNGTIQNLFLVLRNPTEPPFPGVSGQPPLVGLSTVTPASGLSFVSTDGATFIPLPTLDIAFSLVLAPVPH